MKDFYGREIQIGDRCIRYTGQLGRLEEVIVLGEDKKGMILLILNTKFHILTEHGLLIIDSTDIKQIKPIIFIEEESMPKEFIEYYHLCNKE